jgi:hypothetical protein
LHIVIYDTAFSLVTANIWLWIILR